MNKSNTDEIVWVCKADAEHHAQFLEDGRDTPTPIEVFRHGVVPFEYLDKFQSDSLWYEDIAKFKMNYLVSHVVSGFYQLSEDDFIDEMKIKSLDEKTAKLIWCCLNDIYEIEQSRPK